MSPANFTLPCVRCGGPVNVEEPQPEGTLALHVTCYRSAYDQAMEAPATAPEPDAWLVVGVVRGTGERRVLRALPSSLAASCSATWIRNADRQRKRSLYTSIVVQEKGAAT